MKRLFIFLGLVILSTILVACTEDQPTVTAPSFVDFTIDGSTPVTDGELVRFYKAKNEGIEVTINLSNPDSALITSVIINGKNYRSTRFTDDSTFETITFSMDSGMTLEDTVYSIDDIEYQDGDKIKSVDVTSNNEFDIYVYKSVPTIERESYTLFRDSISLNVSINDPDEVVVYNSLKAQLFSGETLVANKIIHTTDTNIRFVDLLSDKEYELKIIGSYNLDDNNGTQEDVLLYEGVFNTLENFRPTSSLENIEITSNEIEFDVDFTDDDDVTIPGGLSVAIFNDETLVEEITLTGSTQNVVFDDLLNDNEYNIQVLVNYDLRDGFGVQTENVLASYTFDTLPQEVPDPVISNVELTNSRVRFDLSIDDPNQIIDFSTITAELIIAEDIVRSSDISIINPGTSDMYFDVDFQVYNLFSSFEFEVVIRSSYDLNNGEGTQENQIILEQTFSTVANDEPEVSVSDIIVTQGYVTLDLSVSDPDSTLTNTLQAVLYENDIEVATASFNADDTSVVIPYLVYFEDDYRVEIIANYDLRDQTGIKADQVLFNSFMTSLERKIPATEFHNVSVTEDEIELDVILLDADNTIVSNTSFVQLYKDGSLEQSIPLINGTNHVVFSNLLSNNEYTIQVITDYDLDETDANLAPFVEQVLGSTSVLTLKKTVPTVDVLEQTTTTESIVFSVEIIDEDNVIVDNSPIAVLMYNNSPTGDTIPLQPGNNIDIEFDGLLSNNSYEVVLYTDYNLNDGNSDIEDHEFITLNFTTKPKENPSASITDIEADQTTLSIDVNVVDEDGVLNGKMIVALYIDDTPTGDTIPLNEGINTNVTFNTVFSDLRYNVRIFAAYDLNDGEAAFTNELMDRKLVTTEAYIEPTAEIYETVSAEEEIEFNVLVTDEDSVISTIEAVLFENGIETTNTIPLSTGENTGLVFDNLLANTEYEIKIMVNYDLNLNTGVVTDEVLATYAESTGELVLPSVANTSNISGQTSYTTDILIIDPDQVITGNIKAILYKDGAPTASEIVLTTGLNEAITFSNLLSGNQYEIKIFADVNYRDGSNVQTNQEIDSFTIETQAKSLPSFTINSETITDSKITLDFEMDDIDNVLTSSLITASLWSDGAKIAEKSLLSNSVTFDISNMIADFEFEIRLTSNYDLDDGTLEVVNGTIFNETYKTNSFEAPSATIDSVMIKQNQVNVAITVTDNDSVITTRLEAVIYDENNNPLEIIPLEVGENDIVFSQSLVYQEFYTIAVESTYNLLDGEGNHTDQILVDYNKLIYNKMRPEASIENIIITGSSIQFDTTILDKDSTNEGNAIATIYNDKTLVDSFALSIGSNDNELFSGLLSNTTYTVVITVDYDISNGNGVMTDYILDSYSFTTETYDLPTATITNEVITNDSLTVDVTLTDDDSVTTANRYLELYDTEDNFVAQLPISVGPNTNLVFSGLLSNTAYTLTVVTDYDLQDGSAEITNYEMINETQTTTAKTIPSITVNFLTATKGSISFDVDILDPDGTVTTNLKAVLYKDGVATGDEYILSVGNNTHTFAGLLSNTTYEVHFVTDYDLNDGSAVVNDHELNTTSITTTDKTAPTADISNVSADYDTITFDIDITDTDSVMTTDATVNLVLDGSVVASKTYAAGTFTSETFSGLESGKDYTLEVIIPYDLNDGESVQTETLDTDTISTDAKAIPSATIQNITTTYSVINFDVTVTDNDAAITGNLKAVLYKDGVATGDEIVLTVGNNSESFTGLFANAQYDIKVEVDYDINDGNPAVTAGVITESTTTTEAKQVPQITVTEINITENQVVIDYELDDVDGVLIPGTVKAHLVLDGSTVATQSVSTNTVSFDISGLLANYEFEIIITGDYNLDDEHGLIDDGTIETIELSTIAYEAPSAIISDTVVQDTTLDMTVDVTDDDSMSSGNLEAILYDSTGNVLDTIALTVGSNNISFDYIIREKTVYRVEIQSDYDLQDGQGNLMDQIITEQVVYINYKPRIVPTSTIDSITPNQTTLDVDITLIDHDSITTNRFAVLYKDGVEVDSIELVIGTNNIQFTGLLTDAAYEVKVVTDYDLDDGNGVQTDQILATDTTTTLAKVVPTSTIDSITPNQTSIDVDITFTDIDAVSSNRFAVLYKDGVEVDSIELIIGTNNIQFTGLLTDAAYEVKVVTDYDLDDGNGVQTDQILATDTTTTLAKVVPTSTIDSITPNQTSIDVDITFTDIDAVSSNRFATLYLDGVEVDSIALTVGTNNIQFTTLLAGTEYEVKIVTDYDLGDGNGIITDTVLATQTDTTEDMVVISNITNDLDANDKGRHTLDVTIDDSNSILTSSLITATLYENGTTIATYIVSSDTTTTINMINLYNNYDYKLVFTASYNPGTGTVTEDVYEYTFKTESLTAPSAIINSVTPGETTIDVDVTITDDDAVSSALTAKLFLDGTEVDSIILSVGANNIQFSGLLTDAEYEVQIVADYNLLDSNGIISDAELATDITTTDSRTVPSAVINSVTPGDTTIDVDVTITDDDAVSSALTAKLFLDGTEVDSIILSVGANNIQFSGLLTDAEYEVQIVADYNLLDSNGIISDAELATNITTTDSRTVPSAVINSVTPGDTTIDVDVTITDDDAVSSALTAKLFLDGTEVDSIILSVGANNIQFSGLLTGTEYEVQIVADYDLGDGDGTISADLDTEVTTTVVQVTPIVAIETFQDWTLTPNVSFDLTVGADTDSVANDTEWVAYLYVDGVLQETVDIDNVYGNPENTTTTITFGTYATSAGETYTVLITAEVDLGDGVVVSETALASATGIDAQN